MMRNVQLPLSIDDLRLGMRFVRRLPGFLRRPVTIHEARAIITKRLAERAADFLTIARTCIYSNPRNPYCRLLHSAGCEYGDLVRLVVSNGLEESLRTLLRQGIYLSVSEFKAKTPVVRGSLAFEVDPNQLSNPSAELHFPARSGGSSGAARPLFMDLSYIRDRAADTLMTLDARGGIGWTQGIWGIPGGSSMIRVLESAAMGVRMRRWFSQLDAGAPGLHPRYMWSARAMRLGGMLAGRRLPEPEHVPLSKQDMVLDWLSSCLSKGRIPQLHTFSSVAVRLCRRARETGIDISGTQFQTGGELLTDARLQVIRGAGAEAYPVYASMETGPIAYGCLRRSHADDLHVVSDLHAVIQPGSDGNASGLPSSALLVTSLRSTATIILLNTSMGDHAFMIDRMCGCELEKLGWGTHLHTVRSFEKLTAGGMTILDVDVVRILEELLPRRFGGIAGDYQLLEEETEQGQPRLSLLVNPGLGPMDAGEVGREFLGFIRAGSPAQEVMGRLWRETNMVNIVRLAPVATGIGKIHPILRVTAATADRQHSAGA